MGDRLFGLPHMPEKDFNRIMKQNWKDAPQWSDSNGNKLIEPEEIFTENTENLSRFVKSKSKKDFTTLFNCYYRIAAVQYRRELVNEELSLTYVAKVETDLEEWLRANTKATEADIKNYKAGVKELLLAGEVMNDLWQKQIGYTDELKLENVSGQDQELLDRYDQPWCLGNSDPFCTALSSIPERGSGVFMDGITCDQAKGSLLSLENPFSVVKYDRNGFLIPVPYAVEFGNEQIQGAIHLRNAASFFYQIENEKEFGDYLMAVANAFLSNKPFPFVESDAKWVLHGESDSIFYLRVGPDEVGGDGLGDDCGTKSRYAFRLGLINNEAKSLVERYGKNSQKWEDRVAELIGDTKLYKKRDISLSLPQFYDVIFEEGDAKSGGPAGTTVGQTLPNWGGKTGSESAVCRVMIYVNKSLLASKKDRVKKYILPLLEPDMERYYFPEYSLNGIVVHEITHNLGPKQSLLVPGSDSVTYGTEFGKWSNTMEEAKAEFGSIFFAGELLKEAREKYKKGEILIEELAVAEEEYKKETVSFMVWVLKMVTRATKEGKFEGGSYSRLAAIALAYLSEVGAITYNEEKGYWTINFENDVFMNGVEKLMKDTLVLYANHNFADIDRFITYYLEGDGFKLLHHERIQEVAGDMPSPVVEYNIEGLE